VNRCIPNWLPALMNGLPAGLGICPEGAAL
jgi:hypothetical protein